MDITFHYPPELTELLISTIPLLSKGKPGVLLFFQGAGVSATMTNDLAARVAESPKTISKYEIARVVLTRINEGGEATLRQRREILKRVTEFEDFSTLWPDDQPKAKGFIADVRRVVNVKDSFTRINQERQAERQQRIEEAETAQNTIEKRKAAVEEIRIDLNKLFFETNAQKRGKALEPVLNKLFQVHGILLQEAFTLKGISGQGIIEQIDGVIELDGHVYLVEMKWTNEPLGPGDVAQHLVRVFGRGHARGIFISASGYTDAALQSCRESLRQSVFALCTLQEFVFLLERQTDLKTFIKSKVNAAIVHKNPLHDPIAAGEA